MKKVDYRLFTLKGWYAMFRPVAVPYSKLAEEAKKAGYTVKEDLGVWENAPMFGRGTIGVVVESDDNSLMQISGEFEVKELTGPYKQMGPAYQEIMRNNPDARDFYNVYLNKPQEVEEKDLRTDIYYK